MIVNGGDDGDVSRLPSPPFGICVSNQACLRQFLKFAKIASLSKR